ncbi:MAG: hypothetical protein HZB20_06430, partial [Chloroflexi bacterium]|nr:hypothetical protein [Chloroflexota bacterium]
YSNGSQIQGNFSLQVTGPADLASVTFLIDDQPIGASAQAPFTLSFVTDDYAPGWHTLRAGGRTAAGNTLTSATRRFEFVTGDQALSSVSQILFGMLGLLGGALVVVIGSQVLLARLGHKTTVPLGSPRRYGIMGGTVCPKCHRPFAIHWWGLNAGLRKYDRCDHCGKWSLVSRLSPQQLAAAEAEELKLAQPEPSATAAEQLKRQLDDSRYLDQ